MEWKNKMDRSTGTNGLMSYAKLRNRMSLRFAKHYCQDCYHAGDDPCPVHGGLEMTPEQINREIAERVMGWHEHPYYPTSLQSPHVIVTWHDKDDKPMQNVNAFNPAERIDHAWMVVEQLFVMNGNDYHCIHIEHLHKKWSVSCCYELGEWKDWIEADTAQMAICLAALEAVKEGWEDRHGRTPL
jgi:hypothetical protein